MEGRAIARPNASPRAWRRTERGVASMEGRAIARPNVDRRAPPPKLIQPCRFNGGPGNCPAKRAHGARWPVTARVPSFNGGPGNCPAKPPALRGAVITSISSFNGGPGNCPAKRPASRCIVEGRAIARPHRPAVATSHGLCFNGGPGNCPAKRDQWRAGSSWRINGGPKPNQLSVRRLGSLAVLQWRAGQLPGQTAPGTVCSRPLAPCFNGGPGNCPAKPGQATSTTSMSRVASMEGRAIARPNVRAGR